LSILCDVGSPANSPFSAAIRLCHAFGVRTRLDQALVERGLCETRERAKRAIMAGEVRINGQVARKASDGTRPSDAIEVTGGEKYVSRGGNKLEHALDHFEIKVEGLTAIDLGASTGGFTDCLLQRGAARVLAVDVGQGQLAWKLRNDPRVVVMEKTNARTLSPGQIPTFCAADLVVIDCSFISLRKIVPVAIALVKPFGKVVALIKPQFEAGKEEADRGRGVIKDPEIHARIVAELEKFVGELGGASWRGVTDSPLLGPAGNKEFLVLIEKCA
jgi:23S rRNA (cytidine1920-2'-O)/16S rRNA (cytidine1409-2'-O)-methyltransferase